LGQRVAEVGVLRVAAVARPPARVDGQLHQIREPSNLLGARCFAARQVVGVVVDVLVHVFVQHCKRLGVGRIPASAGDFTVLDAAELVVLLPRIGLEDLGRGQELENRRVSRGQAAARVRRRRIGQQPPRANSSCSDCGAFEQEGAPGVEMLFGRFHDLLLRGSAS
jgi:hypothetical protein